MKRKLHDTASACDYLGNTFKPNTMEIKRVNGTGPRFIKIGRLVRYDETDLDAWLESRIRTSTTSKVA